MSQVGYLILAISILVVLLIIFIVSFVLYKRTPVPQGCENIHIDQENCAKCSNENCTLKSKKEEEK